MRDIPDSAFRLKWAQTWPDKPGDFAASEPLSGSPIGRIYQIGYGATDTGKWYWATYGKTPDGRLMSGSGTAGTAREAAMALEEHWFMYRDRVPGR